MVRDCRRERGLSRRPLCATCCAPLRILQNREFEKHAEAVAQYETAKMAYEQELSNRGRAKGGEELPEKPERPVAVRLMGSDVTVEGLIPILQENRRGVLVTRDEIAGWLGSFDRYIGKRAAGDEAHWLSMYSGESITVDRKTGSPRTIHVPSALVSVTGGFNLAY